MFLYICPFLFIMLAFLCLLDDKDDGMIYYATLMNCMAICFFTLAMVNNNLGVSYVQFTI